MAAPATVKRWRAAVALPLAVLGLTGCVGGVEASTGDALFAEAEQHYRDYRAVTNEIHALIFEGPWVVPPGSYGMQPADAGCPDGTYRFDLWRTLRLDPEGHDARRAAVVEFLEGAGYEIEGMDLGSGDVQSSDVIVRQQGDFSLLMVTFVTNGSVLVSASTKCWPGDRMELREAMFGGVTLSEGYLPREESPSDPLFFGVTPGEPAFGPSPRPSESPS